MMGDLAELKNIRTTESQYHGSSSDAPEQKEEDWDWLSLPRHEQQ